MYLSTGRWGPRCGIDTIRSALEPPIGGSELFRCLSALAAVRATRQYGRVSDSIRIAVVGAHLQGQPLNHQLTDRGARLITATRTASCYRLYALATIPPKPGLMRVDRDDPLGAAIDVEVWELDAAAFGDFVAQIPAPMCIGRVQLADGGEVSGFLCEPIALEGAAEITRFGGWRAYQNAVTDRG